MREKNCVVEEGLTASAPAELPLRGVATRCTAAPRRLHTPCFSQALAVATAAVRWKHNRRLRLQFRACSVRRQHRLRRRPRPPPREQRAVRRSRGRGQQRYRRPPPAIGRERTIFLLAFVSSTIGYSHAPIEAPLF
jgi:hypothetical protein